MEIKPKQNAKLVKPSSKTHDLESRSFGMYYVYIHIYMYMYVYVCLSAGRYVLTVCVQNAYHMYTHIYICMYWYTHTYKENVDTCKSTYVEEQHPTVTAAAASGEAGGARQALRGRALSAAYCGSRALGLGQGSGGPKLKVALGH